MGRERAKMEDCREKNFGGGTFLVDEKSVISSLKKLCGGEVSKHRHYINGKVASSRSGFRRFKRILLKSFELMDVGRWRSLNWTQCTQEIGFFRGYRFLAAFLLS